MKMADMVNKNDHAEDSDGEQMESGSESEYSDEDYSDEDEEDDDEEKDSGEEHDQNEEDGEMSEESIDPNAESCAICLCPLMNQDIGVPESCDHLFCLECIFEWSKKANTCPLDKIVFRLILARHGVNGEVYKQVCVNDTSLRDDEVTYNDVTLCEVCGLGNREDRLLLCDGCDLGFHCECLEPSLNDVPIGEWFCSTCSAIRPTNEEVEEEVPTRRRIPRRLIGRTIISEQVRAAVSRVRRRRRIIESSESEDSEVDFDVVTAFTANIGEFVPRVPRTNTTTKRRRKSTRRKSRKRKKPALNGKSSSTASTSTGVRRRRKRRTKRKCKSKTKARTKRDHPLTVKTRLAGVLGLSSPPPGRTIPIVRKPGERTTGRFGQDREVQSLSIYGDRDQLDPFVSSDNDDDDNGAEVAVGGGGVGVLQAIPHRSRYSSAAIKSRLALLPPKAQRLKRATTNNAKPMINESSTCDLLGSILSGQDLLHTNSKNITIQRDGSLQKRTTTCVEDLLDSRRGVPIMNLNSPSKYSCKQAAVEGDPDAVQSSSRDTYNPAEPTGETSTAATGGDASSVNQASPNCSLDTGKLPGDDGDDDDGQSYDPFEPTSDSPVPTPETKNHNENKDSDGKISDVDNPELKIEKLNNGSSESLSTVDITRSEGESGSNTPPVEGDKQETDTTKDEAIKTTDLNKEQLVSNIENIPLPKQNVPAQSLMNPAHENEHLEMPPGDIPLPEESVTHDKTAEDPSSPDEAPLPDDDDDDDDVIVIEKKNEPEIIEIDDDEDDDYINEGDKIRRPRNDSHRRSGHDDDDYRHRRSRRGHERQRRHVSDEEEDESSSRDRHRGRSEQDEDRERRRRRDRRRHREDEVDEEENGYDERRYRSHRRDSDREYRSRHRSRDRRRRDREERHREHEDWDEIDEEEEHHRRKERSRRHRDDVEHEDDLSSTSSDRRRERRHRRHHREEEDSDEDGDNLEDEELTDLEEDHRSSRRRSFSRERRHHSSQRSRERRDHDRRYRDERESDRSRERHRERDHRRDGDRRSHERRSHERRSRDHRSHERERKSRERVRERSRDRSKERYRSRALDRSFERGHNVVRERTRDSDRVCEHPRDRPRDERIVERIVERDHSGERVRYITKDADSGRESDHDRSWDRVRDTERARRRERIPLVHNVEREHGLNDRQTIEIERENERYHRRRRHRHADVEEDLEEEEEDRPRELTPGLEVEDRLEEAIEEVETKRERKKKRKKNKKRKSRSKSPSRKEKHSEDPDTFKGTVKMFSQSLEELGKAEQGVKRRHDQGERDSPKKHRPNSPEPRSEASATPPPIPEDEFELEKPPIPSPNKVEKEQIFDIPVVGRKTLLPTPQVFEGPANPFQLNEPLPRDPPRLPMHLQPVKQPLLPAPPIRLTGPIIREVPPHGLNLSGPPSVLDAMNSEAAPVPVIASAPPPGLRAPLLADPSIPPPHMLGSNPSNNIVIQTTDVSATPLSMPDNLAAVPPRAVLLETPSLSQLQVAAPPLVMSPGRLAGPPPPLPTKVLEEMTHISQIINASSLNNPPPVSVNNENQNIFKVPYGAPPQRLNNDNLRSVRETSSMSNGEMEVVDMDVASPASDDDFGVSFSPPSDKTDKSTRRKGKRASRDHAKAVSDTKKTSQDILKSLNQILTLDKITKVLEEEVPTSAVELEKNQKGKQKESEQLFVKHNSDLIKKLNRQERVAEEVKLALKPHYVKGRISKEEYKEILRKAVPKVCHSKSGVINPLKIKSLVEAYINKTRALKKYQASTRNKSSSASKSTGAKSSRGKR